MNDKNFGYVKTLFTYFFYLFTAYKKIYFCLSSLKLASLPICIPMFLIHMAFFKTRTNSIDLLIVSKITNNYH